MATVKHKINEISKDFSLDSKKIIAIVGEITDEPKKSVSVLTGEELDYIFDKLTTAHAVKDFNAYFQMAKPAEQAEEKKPAAKKAAKTSDQSATAAFIVLFLAGVSMAGASRLRRSRKQS